MTNANLYALFQSRFPDDLDKPFLQQEDGACLSYGEMDQLSARMAALLTTRKITKGDRILVQVEKSMEAVCLYLACLRVGAIYLPLNTAYTAHEVAYFIGNASPALLVGNFPAQPLPSLTLDQLCAEAATCPPRHSVELMSSDDLAAILYTSGTTGRSKGAMLSHGNLASNALTLHDIWHWQQDDILLHALPIFHVHGLFVALHCALLGGSTVWFLPRLDADALIRLIPKSTVLMGVPTFYTRLLAHGGFTKDLCQKMRLFISGSAPLLAETFHQFEAITGQRILERYGMTEAGMITSNPYDGPRIAGTVGPALPDVEVRICGEDGRQLPAGEIGSLEYKGPNLFKGYWEMPKKTAEDMRPDGFFISGDLAIADQDGRISIVGRSKDLIISGGFNIYPKGIESVLDLLPGVLESAVVASPHPDLGEAVMAVVVRTDNSPLTEQDILDQLSDQLARFKQPRKVIFTDALPRNTMGKVQKNILRDQMKDIFKS
ncbi:MAG: malonyl-CoA synthase [Alphaproteobacteria bacterium]|nr:MAG: malonyl-CoA synthase [Alphaproteobacteria bacterium]